MKKTTIGLLVLSILILVSCAKNGYERYRNGIVIKVDSMKVRLQVISDDIIRVSATVNDTLPADTSLIALAQAKMFTDFTVDEEVGKIVLKTKTLIAEVNESAGAVVFKDLTGKILLQEKQGGGKTFTKTSFEGTHYYAIKQVFESPDDEAFYGLGGHQNGQMNYKGQDVELAQHNMVPCIPFLYSNKNYGILWDNYSITRFGDSRPYEQISGLKLFSKDGKEGGLTATYSVDGKVVKTQIENKIDYTFDEEAGQLNLDKNVDSNKGLIVWEGSVASDVEGKHKFILYASSYFKLWVDGKLVFDKWRQNWNPWTNPFEIPMKKGEKHAIKIEWIPNGGYMGLTHLDPLSVEDQNRLSLSSEAAHAIDYYFVRGNNADEVIAGYRAITGKATIVPKWAMGFWQSRERYKTQAEILENVKMFRDKHIGLDNIVLDWFYWPENAWGSQKFDSSRFPNPAEMTKELHQMNAHIMISVWPKYYEGIPNYKAMDEKGYLYKHNIEKGRLDWVYPGYKNTYYDAFNPKARDMFWSQIKPAIYDKGFDAWWLDATEPDMHSNISIQERKLNMNPTALGTGEEYFNAFALVNAKGVYESQRATNKDARVFILTRSAFAGLQHYGAATWSGDIVSRWSDLKDQISNGVNFSMSGLPYWTMDIGGFALEDRYYNPDAANLAEWREIQTRWYQFGSFCPLFRVHGQFPLREIYNIAPENHPAYQSMLYYNKLRYTLMPYIYTLAQQTYHTDYTIMRGLVMDFGADKNVLGINDQYMFGPSLLINPVFEYKATKRTVYLPDGQGWFDLYSGSYFNGGQTIAAQAPYDRIPVFVKEGSIIPTGEPMEYTNQKPDSVITLYVYGGKDAKFDLYSDESINYNYEQGKFVKIPISYNQAKGEITIGKRVGEYKGMLKSQSFKIVYIDKNHPVAFGNIKAVNQLVKYTGNTVNVKVRLEDSKIQD